MKILRWFEGRQKNCKYWKFPLWYFKLGNYGFDCYILKYIPGILPTHTDLVEGKHYRLNIKLKGNATFICEETIFRNKLFVLFRPDLYLHALNIKTKTYKLSFGFVKFKKNE